MEKEYNKTDKSTKEVFIKHIPFAAIFSISCYVAFQIFSDILSTKIAFITFLGLAIDGGTVIYPLTFTLRDFIHKTVGKENARQIILLSGILNIIMVLLFLFVGKLPADSSWAFQDAYDNILLPIWRITIASIIAEIISELIDTEIFSLIIKKWKKRDVLASLGSNFVSLLFDSVIFGFIAFSHTMPFNVVIQIIISNILVKAVMSIISSPAIKLIKIRVSEEDL